MTSTGTVLSVHFDCVLPVTNEVMTKFKDYVKDVVSHGQHWRPARVSAGELQRTEHQLLHDFDSTTYQRMTNLLKEFAPQDERKLHGMQMYRGDMMTAPLVRKFVLTDMI